MPAAASADLMRDFEAVIAQGTRPAATAAELERNLVEIYRSVFAFDFDRYDPASVAREAPRLISALFDLRMGLRDRIPDWQKQGLMTLEVQKALRDAFRILRYAGDMVGEIMIGHVRLAEGELPRRAFSSPDLNTLVHRAFDTGQPIPFRSGDVILVRGLLTNSAAIARIGDVDSQFSHVGLVYVDDAGKPWVVEALIEDGAVINPLEKLIDRHVGRAILFRPKEPALAAAAAKLIHDHVRKTLHPGGKRILYDFSMRLAPYKRLFCAKLVRLAYAEASGGRVLLPTYHTRFNRNRDFFRRIGVKTMETFAPADMELEPGFHLVAEWQDYRATSRLRMQDLVLTKFFEWMETKDYKFREDWIIRLVGIFGRLAANLSDRAKDLISSVIPKIPSNMRRRTIATIAMLHKSTEPVLQQLQALEDQHAANTGRPLHPRQVFEWLEQMRVEKGGHIGYLSGPR